MKTGLHLHGDTDVSPAMDRGCRTFTVLDQDRHVLPEIMRRIPAAEHEGVLIHIRQLANLDLNDGTLEASARNKGRELARIAWENYPVWPRVTWVYTFLNEPEIEDDIKTPERVRRLITYEREAAIGFRHEWSTLGAPGAYGTKVLLGTTPPSPGNLEDGPDTVGTEWPEVYAERQQVWAEHYHVMVLHLYEPTPLGQSSYWHGLRIFRPPIYKDDAEGMDAGDPGGLYWVAVRLGMKIIISEANLTN